MALVAPVGSQFWLCAFLAVASLFLGGSTRGGALSDAVLQFLCIPLLLIFLWRITDATQAWPIRWALACGLAVALVPLAQLIPLPPALWAALPQREASAAALRIAGQDIPWMPISVSPHATWLSALSLLVPLTMFAGTLLLDHRERRWLSLVFLAAGIVSVFLGLLQLAQGPESSLRLFEITNTADAVGFFANRNHFAALLYSLMLFAAAWAVHATMAFAAEPRRKEYDGGSIVALVVSFTILVVLLAAQLMARSRAGLGLTIIALFAAFALTFSAQGGGSGVRARRLLFGALAFAVVCGLQVALYRALDRFTVDPMADGRLAFARTTIEAALAYMPFGSGAGTFVPVHAVFEKPADMLADAYVNRAHNDFLEVWLETGVLGPALIGLFAMWLAFRSITLWRRTPPGGHEIDYSLARAASAVVGLLAAHSVVDYPLRTGAIMAVMAFACALLIEPAGGARPVDQPRRQGREKSTRPQRKTPRSSAPLTPSWPPPWPGGEARPEPLAPAHPRGDQGEDIEWPEEWRAPPNQRNPGVATPPPNMRTPPKK